MGGMTRRKMIGQTIIGGIALLAPLEAFAQTTDRMPAEIGPRDDAESYLWDADRRPAGL